MTTGGTTTAPAATTGTGRRRRARRRTERRRIGGCPDFRFRIFVFPLSRRRRPFTDRPFPF